MARTLHNKGYRDVYALRGGFDEWVNQGLPTISQATDAGPLGKQILETPL